MANRRDIKRRISSVINTQKITKAMKLVAAAKFARASHAVQAARPYSQAFDSMVKRLVGSARGEINSPLLAVPEEKKAIVVVLGTDRGLCGGLNNNMLRFLRYWLDANKKEGSVEYSLIAWGRKAISWSKKQDEDLIEQKEKVLERPNYLGAKTLTEDLVKRFITGECDAIYLACNRFVNALTQKPEIVKLLPIKADELAGEGQDQKAPADFIVEPGLAAMLERLLERRLSSLIFQAMLDGAASEHGSRMTAMDNATTNATEVRKKLVLRYNRARQAAITKELIEIISGAEAL